MKKLLSIFLVLLVSNSLSAQKQNEKVYFIRSEGLQAPAASFNVFIDKKFVGKLSNKKFSVHDVTPGKHTFSIQFAGKNPNDKAEKMDEEIEAGKTYYIQVNFQHGVFKNKLHFKEINEEDAKEILPHLREIKS